MKKMKQIEIILETNDGERNQVKNLRVDEFDFQFFKDDDGNIVMKEM